MTINVVDASWCEISLKTIANNLKLALGLLPEASQYCAVVKADAYGHGIDKVVPIIIEAGVEFIGITSNSEARAVRDAGFLGTIMRLRTATRSEIEGALEDKVQEQISTVFAAKIIKDILKTGRTVAGLHLSLNARGMSRDGLELSVEAGQQACVEIINLVGDQIVGICSHFPSNMPEELTASDLHFQQDVNWVFANCALDRKTTKIHAGSSLTLVSGVKITTDLYRCGAIMYGILNPELGFETSMHLKSYVTNVATYPKGSTIGYDRASILQQDRQLANISIGYSNGINRVFFDQSEVLVRGHCMPVLGKISMNSIMADVTDLHEISVGDEVVVFGNQNGNTINVETMELQAGTIMADIFTDWGQRNRRIYIK